MGLTPCRILRQSASLRDVSQSCHLDSQWGSARCQQIAELTAKIKQYNRLIQQSGQTELVVLRSSGLKDDDNIYTYLEDKRVSGHTGKLSNAALNI
jgi:hypothetical protein